MKTILVIDDDKTFRFLLAEWLKNEGFDSITAGDGFEGVRLAGSRHPDLIFCNVNMPIFDGIEVLKQVRDDGNIAHIPFFFLTSEVRPNPSFMQQLGASGVISKGAEIQELRQALNFLAV